jgi:LacI family transcriptional regulator
MPKQPATIYDIAELLGLSASTVSRALNKPGRVNAVTQHRIEEAARELGYRVNTAARSIKTGRREMLGVLAPDVTYTVFQDVLRGAEQAADERGYLVLVGETSQSSAREEDWLARVQTAVDGVVLTSPRADDASVADLAERMPVVLVNRRVDGVPSVVPDVEPGLRAAVARLWELGHRRLLYLSGPQRLWMSRHRHELLDRLCRERGIEVRATASGSGSFERGAEAADEVLASGCTAVVAFNDLIAIGVLKELEARGVRVPDQVSIVGFDNIRGSDYTSPPLATIGAPLQQVGAAAVRELLAAVDGVAPSPPSAAAGRRRTRPEELPTVFHDRGSLGPAPG